MNRIWYDINEVKPKVDQEVWATIVYPKDFCVSSAVYRKTYHGEPEPVDYYGHINTEDEKEYSRWWMDSAFSGARVIAWMPTDEKPDPYDPKKCTVKPVVKISKAQYNKIRRGK